jgi:hypothetical protein
VVALVLIAVIVASPLLTYGLSSYGFNWTVLSNVGQSYGPIATILSGVALIGVVATVNLQSRQTRVLAEQAIRQMQLELMREAWRDPDLLSALEVVPDGQGQKARQHAFLNTYFMYLRMGLMSGHISESEIEEISARCFSTSPGALYWQRGEEYLRRHFEDDFVKALDRGYARAQQRMDGVFIDPAAGSDEQA